MEPRRSQDLKEYTRDELTAQLQKDGLKRYAASQLFRWIYQKRVEDFSRMTDLAQTTRDLLLRDYTISRIVLERTEHSSDGTQKFLLCLADGAYIEAVSIPETDRHTLCVSSQVGCHHACAFCISGKGGFKRNLTAAEIVNQYLMAFDAQAPHPITNVVFMGIGEPLDNLTAVGRAIKILTDPHGIGLSPRKVSVSTCGILQSLEEFYALNLGVKLSLSLHTADPTLRSHLMPCNKKNPLNDVIALIRKYHRTQRYPVIFEYVLLRGRNTRPEDAEHLARLLKGIRYKINLIPFNATGSSEYEAPNDPEIEAFIQQLKKRRIFYTVRRPKGYDISAACGQLRWRAEHAH